MRTLGNEWWLPLAAAGAVLSGLSGALHLMWGGFVIGGGLLALSVVLLRWPRSIWCGDPAAELSPRRRRLALLAVCVLAVFFRTYRMEPPGLWGDDAINALLAFDVIDGKVSSPFQLVAHSHSHFHALSNYPIAATFWAFGADLSTLRIPGIVAGILAVPLLYGTVAPLFGARVALVSALFFASSPVQIAHSKFLIQIVLGEFFQLLGLCLLVRGIMGRRPWLVSAAAVPFAFCVYTYHAAKLAPLVVLPFLVAALGCQRLRRRLAWPGTVAVILFLLFLVPAVQSYSSDPGALTARLGGTWLWSTLSLEGSLWPLWDAVWRTLMAFHYRQGPTYHWFGLGFDPAVNVVIAFLLVHGFVVSLRHWREPRHLLLLSWVIVGLLPGVLSTNAPRIYRILLATAPLYVWAAFPVVRLAEYVAASGVPQRILRGVAALLVVAVPLIDFNYYFHRVYQHPDFRWFQGERIVEMARTLKQFGPDWTGYLLAEDFSASHETLRFLSRAWGIRIHNVASLAEVLPLRELPAGGVLFMMTRRTLGAAAAIANMYPTGELLLHDDTPTQSQWFDDWWSVPVHQTTRDNTIAFFPVSRKAVNGIHGITTTFLAADGRRLGIQVDSQPRLDEALGIANQSISAARVSWSGGLFAPANNAYRFVLQANVSAQVWIDGLEVVSSQHPTATWHLAEGLHQFDAAAALSSEPELQLSWQPAGKNQEVIPRSQFFTRPPNGLLAAYSLGDQDLQRIEPYPYYEFFPLTFPERFTVHWRGALHVPPPGGYRVSATTNGASRIWIDGAPFESMEELSPGVYDFDLQIANVPERAHLQLYWAQADSEWVLIPPEAWTPPESAGAHARLKSGPG